MLFDDRTIEVLGHIMRDPTKSYYGRDLAKKKRINQKSVSNLLNRLEDEGVLRSGFSGKTKEFELVFDCKTQHYFMLVESAKTILFYKKNPKIMEIINKILPYTEGVLMIFGSYAKGLQTKDSDLDIFLAGRCDIKKIREVASIYGIMINIKEAALDAVLKSLKEKSIFINEIVKDHVIITDNGFIKLMLRHYYGHN